MKNLVYIFALISLPKLFFSQSYADSETNSITGSCVGCSVVNAPDAVDGDLTTCSTLSLGTCTSTTIIDQNLHFSLASSGGQYVGIVVSDINSDPLDLTDLSSVEITTFSNSVSNNDTQNSSEYTINPISPNSYALEFFAASAFDEVELKLTSGVTGGVTALKVYYAYYSSSVLPIEEVSLEANVKDQFVQLEFQSDKIEANACYTIEKSIDAVVFEPLYSFKTGSACKSKQAFDYKDFNPVEGLSYYRVMWTKSCGTSQALPPIAVEYKRPLSKFSVYPNPATSDFSFSYFLKEDSRGILAIYDTKGNKLRSYELSAYDTRLIVEQDLEPGVYYYEYSIDGKAENKEKLIVLGN